jgi:hypothetical protein
MIRVNPLVHHPTRATPSMWLTSPAAHWGLMGLRLPDSTSYEYFRYFLLTEHLTFQQVLRDTAGENVTCQQLLR